MKRAEEEMWAPAEELVKAFLDYLVEPLLPLKLPSVTPLESNQEKVAKQMHAVVLLYNYYQRKRHAHAEYLDFMSFCKLVVTLKPVLAAYMTSMQTSESTDSQNPESQFSVTQKAIEDACTIATLLDVSRDGPDVNEWVVSKVAVFLVNSSKENCALSFSSHTDGVWSLFEKSITNCVDNQENQAKGINPNKRKRKKKQPTGEPDLKQLAFSALKEARGIERSHLTILEKHVTYSLDKERTAACCFIIECRSTNQEFEFSVRDIIESLQGPLLKKISGDWTLTQLIEYYNVLPYAGIILSWFSRQFLLICSELLIDVPEYKKLDSKSVDNSLSELVDLKSQSSQDDCDFSNAKVQEDACEKSYMNTRSKSDSTDVQSEKTYDDDSLAKRESTESTGNYDNGPETENVKKMDVDLSGKRSGSEVLSQRSKEEIVVVNVIESNKSIFANANHQEDSCEKRPMTLQGEVDRDVKSDRTCDYENLPKRKSNEHNSDYHNGSKRQDVKGIDVNLSGMSSGAETLPQRSKEETMDINGIKSKKSADLFDKEANVQSSARLFEKEANVQSSSKNPIDNVKCAQQSSKWTIPEETYARIHSENNNNPGPVSIISANDGVLKETEQPSVQEIQPSIKEVDKEESSSTNSLREEVNTFNNSERPTKEVKDLLKNHYAAESSLTCKRETNQLVLYDKKDLQLESGGPHVDDNQESSGTLTSEVNSTIISLLGDANADSKLKSDENVANEEDLKLCKSDSRCESNSDLLCSRKDLPLKSGYIGEENILEVNLLNEVSDIRETIISQTNDTDGVRSGKPDLKLVAQSDLECGTTDKKLDLGLSTQKTSKCGKLDSSLQKDVSMPTMPIAVFPSSPIGKVSDESPTTCPKEQDKVVSTKSVIVYNVKRKRSRNQDTCAPTVCTNNELSVQMETAKGVKSCNAVCRDKIETNRVIVPFNMDTPVSDAAIIPVESVHSTTNNLQSVLASKETELSKAALGILLQKKNELCHQQQEIQDQIALCDQSIQKILDGNENSLVLKIDTIINCCNDFLNNKTEVQQHDNYNQAGAHGGTQLPRPKTISKPFLLMGSASQKLDNRNANICAPAGEFMSSSTGNVLASVGAGEMDLKCSGEGAPLLVNRESAALDECRPLKMMVVQAPENCQQLKNNPQH